MIQAGDEPFAAFRHVGQRLPIVYPLLGPGGIPVTRAYPMEARPGEATDHPHHRSLWVAHGDVNGHDFWHGEENRVVLTTARTWATGDRTTMLWATGVWMAGATPVLEEKREMFFVDGEGMRSVALWLGLSPVDAAVTFGDTKEGTVALRLHPELRLRGEVATGTALNSEGHTGTDVWGKRARWVAYGGHVEGREVTVAFMDHPKNLRHPTWWHARDYGLVAANPFGVHDFEGAEPGAGDLTLEPGESLHQLYRIVLFDRLASSAEIEEAWAEFAGWGAPEGLRTAD